MSSFVVNAVCLGPECLATSKPALERLRICVDPHMNFQIRSLTEGFSTPWECTLMLLDTTVFLQMICEAQLASVNFVATRKWTNKFIIALLASFSNRMYYVLYLSETLLVFALVFEQLVSV